MIIDTLTHVWESPEQLGLSAEAAARRDALGDRFLHADPVEHFESLGPVSVALVVGFRSRLLEAAVPNRLVAEYVRSHPDRLVGVAGIDPTSPVAVDELEQAVETFGMQAVAISPSAQGFHPMNSRAMPLYRAVFRLNLPMIVYPGPWASPKARLEYASPILLDELLRELEGLRLVLGRLDGATLEPGFALMAKHPQVLASLGSAIMSGPWRAYNALVLAAESGVIDRLLFASDFPFSTPAARIETLYSLNRVVAGTNLPTIPRELLRGIVERDALGMLGIEPPAAASPGRRPAGPQEIPAEPSVEQPPPTAEAAGGPGVL